MRGKDGANVADVVLHLSPVDDAIVKEANGSRVWDVLLHLVDGPLVTPKPSRFFWK